MDRPGRDPLLDGLAAGREDAYAALYDRLAGSMFRVATMLTGSPADAEDAVQDVFVGLVRARQSLANIDNLRAYVFAALRRAAVRLVIQRKAEPAIRLYDAPDIAAPETGGVAIEQAVRLERALDNLPAEQREIITLKVDGGLTFAEIADVLGISPNTAASRHRYALEKLRTALEGCR